MEKRKRLILIDYLKAICVIFVIITHGDFLNDAMLDKNGLFYLLIVNKAVPVFMFLSGFVFALPVRDVSLAEQYNPKKLLGKFLRLFVPSVIAYVVFVIIKALSGEAMGIVEIIKTYLVSDYGRGSYYFPVMVQFILMAPVMNYVISKFKAKGLLILGAVNFIYELLWQYTNLPDGLFRILFFRYLFVVALGMYMCLKQKTGKKMHPAWITAMAVIGLVFILLPYFTGYEYKIFTVAPWNRSSMLSGLYVAAVMYVVFKLFGKTEEKGVISKTFGYIGQASYHIMYTQMMYFVVRPAIDARLINITLLPIWVQFIVDIVVPSALGMVFCMLDGKFFGKFYRIKS